MPLVGDGIWVTLISSLSGEIILQFEVLSDEDDNDVPPVESIALAIDSNLGLQYICLYSFHVHGREA